MSGKRYNWVVIQKYYDDLHSLRECVKEFGMNTRSLVKAARTGRLKTRSRSDAMKISSKDRKHSNKTKEKLSAIAIERKFGGKNYRKTFLYKNVLLESSYELKLAIDLDKNDIRWIRPKRIRWIDGEGTSRWYTPDFYLNDFDLYIDPKNDYLIKIDEQKINCVREQNQINLLVLNKNQLSWKYIAAIAQSAECLASNQEVARSLLAGRSKFH